MEGDSLSPSASGWGSMQVGPGVVVGSLSTGVLAAAQHLGDLGGDDSRTI